MGLLFLVFFPFGAIVIRFLADLTPNPASKHRFVQLSSLFVLMVAVGLGIYLALGHQFSAFRNHRLLIILMIDHYLGIIILIAAITQAGFGWYHHLRYVRDKPTHRRWFTHVHLWLGRSIIIAGLLNCGFGLIIAGHPWQWAFIWWIASGILAILYFGMSVIIMLIRRRSKQRSRGGYQPPPSPGYPLDEYHGSRVNLVNNPAESSWYVPPTPRGPETVSGRYESGRYDSIERYEDQPPDPYDPPRRQFTDPVPRRGSANRPNLHLEG